MSDIPSNLIAAAQPKRAYDRNNLHPLDEEARKYDDTSEGIDWDEILETTEDDCRAGRLAYCSAGYPDEATAWKALEQMMDDILKEVLSRERPCLSRSGPAR